MPEPRKSWVARYTLIGPDGQRYSRSSELPDGHTALLFVALCHLMTSCVMASAHPPGEVIDVEADIVHPPGG